MDIKKTENLLYQFDYKFVREDSRLIIKLDYSQRLIVDFSEPGKIKISDQLVNWNYLTGMTEMSIKSAMIYNFIGSLIITFLFLFIDFKFGGINLVFLYLAFIFWVLLWTMFYLFKSENMKRNIIRWNEESISTSNL